MALDFPNSPTAGQLYAAPNGVTYQWSSTYTAWLPLSVTSAGVGDFFANWLVSGFTSAPTTVLFPNVISGNAGGWYSPGPGGTGRFTPPAGRYYISAGSTISWAGGITNPAIALRKNGTAVVTIYETTGAANHVATPTVEGSFDANGTDWFDIQTQSAQGAMTSTG